MTYAHLCDGALTNSNTYLGNVKMKLLQALPGGGSPTAAGIDGTTSHLPRSGCRSEADVPAAMARRSRAVEDGKRVGSRAAASRIPGLPSSQQHPPPPSLPSWQLSAQGMPFRNFAVPVGHEDSFGREARGDGDCSFGRDAPEGEGLPVAGVVPSVAGAGNSAINLLKLTRPERAFHPDSHVVPAGLGAR
jgi:hypothetical protein